MGNIQGAVKKKTDKDGKVSLVLDDSKLEQDITTKDDNEESSDNTDKNDIKDTNDIKDKTDSKDKNDSKDNSKNKDDEIQPYDSKISGLISQIKKLNLYERLTFLLNDKITNAVIETNNYGNALFLIMNDTLINNEINSRNIVNYKYSEVVDITTNKFVMNTLLSQSQNFFHLKFKHINSMNGIKSDPININAYVVGLDLGNYITNTDYISLTFNIGVPAKPKLNIADALTNNINQLTIDQNKIMTFITTPSVIDLTNNTNTKVILIQNASGLITINIENPVYVLIVNSQINLIINSKTTNNSNTKTKNNNKNDDDDETCEEDDDDSIEEFKGVGDYNDMSDMIIIICIIILLYYFMKKK